MQDQEMKEMLADLIWLNALIATELIQVTENTSAILRKSPPPAKLPAGAPRTPRNSASYCREIPDRHHPRTTPRETPVMLLGDSANCTYHKPAGWFHKSVPDREMDQHLFAGNFKR